MSQIENKNTLFLIPVGLSETSTDWYLPQNVLKTIHSIHFFIVENAKSARQFIKFIQHPVPIQNIEIYELDKHDLDGQHSEIKALLKVNKMAGLMSEAGLPCIADPGTHVVKLAHELDIIVKPMTGPSSILLALISSGLNGQSFKFTGYIPSKPAERKVAIQKLESECIISTQLFIEAPYRNDHLMDDLCLVLKPETMLLLAIELTSENERIICKPAAWWRLNKFEIGKVPCLFGIGR